MVESRLSTSTVGDKCNEVASRISANVTKRALLALGSDCTADVKISQLSGPDPNTVVV